jgi:hypothetical protein
VRSRALLQAIGLGIVAPRAVQALQEREELVLKVRAVCPPEHLEEALAQPDLRNVYVGLLAGTWTGSD